MSSAIEAQGTKVAFVDQITSGALALTFAATGKTITRGSGDFTSDGFYVGQRIRTTNAANLGPFTVTAVTSTVITVSETVVDDSATATEIVYGDLDVAEVRDFSGPGGSAAVRQVSHLRSTAVEKRVGLADEGQFSFNCNFVPTDAGQILLATVRAARTEKNYRVTWSDGTEDTFAAYCTQRSKSGGVDGDVSLAVTLEITGALTETVAS